ncbi:hypothetical protein AAFN88_01560 [Pelagibius sp. CAU 1746]|uniref:hypothetical protein n=1 Tax=Pelagibius sp. CAU 1746 TaxID=3140370 RepID=UPI00325A970A
MDHFSIVQALCRAAIADASPALSKKIERLRDTLAEDREVKQAGALTNILTAVDRTKELYRAVSSVRRRRSAARS